MVKNPWDNNEKKEPDQNKEEKTVIKNAQIIKDKFTENNFFKKAKSFYDNKFKKTPVKIGFLIFLILWILSGIYIVSPSEQAVITRFGKYSRTNASGLHYHIPFPIEKVYVVNVTAENKIEIGFLTDYYDVKTDVPSEGVMLTGDENVVKVDFTVIWTINDLQNYLFKVKNPEDTIKIVAESVIREIIGQTDLLSAIMTDREKIQDATKTILQGLLDKYESGVGIKRINILAVEPPEEVIDSYKDIQRAQLDAQSMMNNAEALFNEKVPQARGNAEKIIKEAESYKAEKVNQAIGDAKRFEEVAKEYQKAKFITEKKLYIETMEKIFGKANVLILDKKNGQSVIPYLLPQPQGK